MFKVFPKNNLPILLFSSFLLAACNGGGGGGGGSSSTFQDDPVPPSPFPAAGTYNGQSYSELGQPSTLANSYPSAYWPTNLTSEYTLQIAFGRNTESSVADLTAFVEMVKDQNLYICSATPVHYNSATNTTFLIGAAHCFVDDKTSPTTLYSSNILPPQNLTVFHGVEGQNGTAYTVKAVYLMQNYCYGDTFAEGVEDMCQNYTPQYQASSNGQGNDLAIIEVDGTYANPNNYPQLAPSNLYPTPYTMAPVLSVGYGVSTQTPTDRPSCSGSGICGEMFYVANYQYWQQDTTGYHYLYNSVYNTKNSNSYYPGYSSLICGGDSGGGDLFWDGTKWLLLSEHTYGPDNSCGLFYNYLPNAATNVSAYYDWIQSIITATDPVGACTDANNCVTNANL